MTFAGWNLAIILLGMVVLFFTELISIDLVALAGLILITLLGFLSPEEAFRGFSSPTIITMIATFIVTGAIRRTGVTIRMGKMMHRYAGASETKNIFVVMALTSVVSSFMNNLAATALLMPAVVSLSQRSRVAISKLLIPLSFGAILGGMNTLIGTTPNILAGDILAERGWRRFQFFEFAPFGITFCVIGAVFFACLGRRFLPKGASSEGDPSLPDLYKLSERFFSVRVPHGKGFDAKTLGELHFGEELGITVDAIVRQQERIEAPSATHKIFAGDLLIVQGRVFEFEILTRIRGITIHPPDESIFEEHGTPLQGGVVEILDSSLRGQKIFQLKLREKFSAVIVGVERGGQVITQGLDILTLGTADRIHIIASTASFGLMASSEILRVVSTEILLQHFLEGRLEVLMLPGYSSLHGIQVQDSELGKLAGINIVAILRDGQAHVDDIGAMTLARGDQLLVVSEFSHLERLVLLSELQIEDTRLNLNFESDERRIVEVVLSPRSWLIGKTLEGIHFRDKYQCQVLAIWRRGNPTRARVARVPLEFGDTLLLQGSVRAISLLKKDTNFVLLSDIGEDNARSSKAPIAIGGLLILILLAAFGLQRVEMSALLGALFVIGFRAISMEEGYKEIDWKIVTLVSCLIPIGTAIERSGILSTLGQWILVFGQTHSLTLTLLILICVSSFLSQLLDNTIAILLLVPICLQLGQSLGIDSRGLAMTVTLAASFVFMSPFSHRANLFVMAAGGYKSRHYFWAGTILTIICTIVMLVLVPMLYPTIPR